MDNDNLIESSILTTIKKLLGLTKDYTAFDMDIMSHINAVISILLQMGVGPENGFIVTGYSETWDQYLTFIEPFKIQEIKTYMYQKVRMIFDPPSNGNLSNAINKYIDEFEYRLYTEIGGY